MYGIEIDCNGRDGANQYVSWNLCMTPDGDDIRRVACESGAFGAASVAKLVANIVATAIVYRTDWHGFDSDWRAVAGGDGPRRWVPAATGLVYAIHRGDPLGSMSEGIEVALDMRMVPEMDLINPHSHFPHIRSWWSGQAFRHEARRWVMNTVGVHSRRFGVVAIDPDLVGLLQSAKDGEPYFYDWLADRGFECPVYMAPEARLHEAIRLIVLANADVELGVKSLETA